MTAKKSPELKIRFRHRQGYCREAGGYTGWQEYQVVEGRKVIGRFDMEHQAQRFIEKREAETKSA